MYTSYYRFSDRPFQLSPDHRFFFASGPHGRAMSYLEYGLAQEEGFIVVTGDIGSGKTILMDHLFARIDGGKYLIAKVATTRLEADDMLRTIASSFGVSHLGLDTETLLQKIETYMVQCRGAGKRILLVVDDAQNVPPRSMEELRMLSSIQFEGQSLLQIFLVGQSQFLVTLASDELEQLRQRVVATYHLESMNASETSGYIQHRLRRVGWREDRPSLTEQALNAIYEQTGGVPRSINHLCDRLLLFGYLAEFNEIDRDVVEEVARELREERDLSLNVAPDPTPNTEAAADESNPIVESDLRRIAKFGRLART